MSMLYQIVEQGRHTAFVNENGDGLAELHPLLARASAIAKAGNSGFAEALSTAAAERGAPLRRAFADEADSPPLPPVRPCVPFSKAGWHPYTCGTSQRFAGALCGSPKNER